VNVVILVSIVLRVAGVGYSLVLLSRSGDRRFGFLTVMLSLMATRQILSARHTTSPIEELPGLAVSVLALLTVYYLSSYVVEEKRLTDRLRGFRKAIEHAGHAILLTDTDGTIEYANPAVESVVGHDPDAVVGENPRLWKSGEHDEDFYAEMWDQISSGSVWEGEIVNQTRSGEHCWVDMTIAPVTDDDGDIERYVAVERDVTDRKERQHRIEQQNDRLDRLNNTNEVLRDVNRDLVAASTREEIERAVCDRFSRSELFEAACILDTGAFAERVTVRTAAGTDEAGVYGERFATGAGRTAVAEVLDQGRPSFVDSTLEEVTDPAAATGVLVPLSYQNAEYGVLFVDAARDNAFEAIDQGLFADLGLTVGDAINAAESRQTLASDDVTELEFRVEGVDDPFVRLSEAIGGTLELAGMSDEGDGCIAYVSVRDCDGPEVAEDVSDTPGIRTAQRVCVHDEASVFRLGIDDSVVTTLARYGAAVTALEITDGQGRLVADVSPSNDVRALVEAAKSVYPPLDLIAQRERERESPFETEFRAALEESLTTRQLEAAQTAYFAGFFEWPRETNGEAVASMMDISQSTFTQHLRAAERKLFRALFEERSNSLARLPNV